MNAVIILGLAASGEAAAHLLLDEGRNVLIVDRDDRAELRQRAAPLTARGAAVRLGVADLPAGAFALAVVSPGIPADSVWVQDLRARGVPVVAELELGWLRRGAGRVLAVTGANGKSTLVKLCAEALQQAALRVAVAGNYGPPVSQIVREHRTLDWLILEVSSFQLETVRTFRPDIGVLLNIQPNHLDRHHDFAAYEGLKARLFAQMTPADIGIVPAAAAARLAALAGRPNTWISFGPAPEADVRYDREVISGGAEQISLAGTWFANEVLGLTAAAAAAALRAAGIPLAHLASAARNFKPLPHRLQDLGAAGGVRFVDDSKATNLAALGAALTLSRPPVRLIAGGRSKQEACDAIKPVLAQRVAAAYLIGEAAPALAAAWQDTIPCALCRTLDRAVRRARAEAHAGDTILLSPGCASFDQFHDFAERGRCFAELFQSIKKGEKE